MTIEQRLRSIETKRLRLMEEISGLTPDQCVAHPRPEKWSIQEIIEHLVLAEADVLGDLSALEQLEPGRRSLKDRALYLVVMFILRFDIPVRVPSRGMIPTGDASVHELGLRWEANHRRLRAWVAASEEKHLDRPLFRHPIAGAMTTTQSLRMLEVHLDRHTRQVHTRLQLMR
jgi:hypothetical protein